MYNLDLLVAASINLQTELCDSSSPHMTIYSTCWSGVDIKSIVTLISNIHVMESDPHSMTQCALLQLLDSCAHIAWCRQVLFQVWSFSLAVFSVRIILFKHELSKVQGHWLINQTRNEFVEFAILIRPSSWFGDKSSNWHFCCLWIFRKCHYCQWCFSLTGPALKTS